MNFYIFFAIFLLLFLSLHFLFYSRVIKKLLVSEKIKRVITTLLIVNYIFTILYIFGRYSDIISSSLYYIFSLSIGVSFVLLMYIIIHEILNLFHKSISSVDKSKREFIKKSGDGALLAMATSYLAIGAYEGSKEPVVNVS